MCRGRMRVRVRVGVRVTPAEFVTPARMCYHTHLGLGGRLAEGATMMMMTTMMAVSLF